MFVTMDFLTSLSENLFKPNVFQFFLGGLIALAVLVIFTYIVQSKRQAGLSQEDKIRTRQYWERQLKDYQNRNTELSKTADSLKIQLDNQAKELSSIGNIKDGLNRKEEALRNETLAKETISGELKNAEIQLLNIKNKLESAERESAAMDKLKEDLRKKEDDLENEISGKEKLAGELKTSQEVYNGLKEQYADLECQVDALNQSLALEITLHRRLKEEHSQCLKSPHPSQPSQPS